MTRLQNMRYSQYGGTVRFLTLGQFVECQAECRVECRVECQVECECQGLGYLEILIFTAQCCT